MAISRPDAERAIRGFLKALGHDPTTEMLRDTPRRVVDAFVDELLAGYDVDIPELLQTGSEPTRGGRAGIVVVRDVNVSTVCPHHLMPAVGAATVAYEPAERILGLGTLAKLVQSYARRLSLQEQIGTNVVDALVSHGARGAYCRLELRHSCLSARGAEQHHASVASTATAGSFATEHGLAALALALGSEPPA